MALLDERRHRRRTAFVGGVPTLPVYEGELQARSLGAKVEAFDEEGRAVIDQVGELVLTEPLPSMPVFFWGDEDGSRYRESYFDDVPGRLAPRRLDRDHLARHRDHHRPLGLDDQPRRHPDRHERDLPRRCSRVPEVLDALVLDLPRRGTSGSSSLFVVLREGAELDDALGRGSRAAPRRLLAAPRPRRDPARRRGAADALRKLLEVPVKRILLGADPAKAASRESLANPTALDYFVELAARRS